MSNVIELEPGLDKLDSITTYKEFKYLFPSLHDPIIEIAKKACIQLENFPYCEVSLGWYNKECSEYILVFSNEDFELEIETTTVEGEVTKTEFKLSELEDDLDMWLPEG